jgi:hypothetical protein
MVLNDQSPAWDFTSVINVVHSLYDLDVTRTLAPLVSLHDQDESPPVTVHDRKVGHQSEGLGDFDLVWQFLDVPSDAPSPNVDRLLGHRENRSESFPTPGELDIASAIKGVRWRDELDGADLEDEVEHIGILQSNKKASKIAKAKEKRKAKVDIHDDAQGNKNNGRIQDDQPKESRWVRRARKKEAKDNAAAAKQQTTTSDVTTDAESEDELQKLRRSPDRRAVIQNMIYGSSPPTSTSPPKTILTRSAMKANPVSASNPIKYQVPFAAGVSTHPQIQPLVHMSESARRFKLIIQLSRDFPTEQTLLLNPSTTDQAFNSLNTSQTGIHIFVDISNILIGFHDALKLAHHIPTTTRIRRVPLSFYNLSLILERGRPASKRVLAGSDLIPSITDAAALGYETNILSRVQKAKELTPRQKKYISPSGSGSETTKLFAPEKWVEQGVDEILHLKMLESILDAESPSTIVLATGDAAEAEYSGGFMRMVERALERGWVVELVSFKGNTSGAYKARAFRERWQRRFRSISLDMYLEELFGYAD